MVSIFARLTAAHRRTKSAAVTEVGVQAAATETEVEGSAPTTEAALALPHGIKPVEHPVEPINHDQPVKCPLPEPSILNDGMIWKERMSSIGARVRADLPVVREGSHLEPKPVVPRRTILPSISAPEHHFVALLDECECDNSSIQNAG